MASPYNSSIEGHLDWAMVSFLHDLHEKSPKDQDDNYSSAQCGSTRTNSDAAMCIYFERSLIFRAISGISANGVSFSTVTTTRFSPIGKWSS